MELTLRDLTALLRGQLDGNPDARVHSIAKIEEAQPGALAFLANPKYESYLYSTRATAVLVRVDFVPSAPVAAALIRVSDPYTAFTLILEEADRRTRPNPVGQEQPSYLPEGLPFWEDGYLGAFAYVGKGCHIGRGVKIYPQAYVGEGCQIGEGTVVHAGARLYYGTVVGRNCIIHAGAVVGADGFGHAPQPDGSYRKIPQLGHVAIGDDVEIGANTCIDRATMGTTRIGQGVKLDNLVQVGHNVEIGAHTVMSAQAGISGSAKVGAHVQLGGQTGISGHIIIGDGARVVAQSGVMVNLEPGQTVIGSPSDEFKKYMRTQILIRKLPELEQRLRKLEGK